MTRTVAQTRTYNAYQRLIERLMARPHATFELTMPQRRVLRMAEQAGDIQYDTTASRWTVTERCGTTGSSWLKEN